MKSSSLRFLHWFSVGETFTHATSRFYSSATVCDHCYHLLELLQLSIDQKSLQLTQQSHAKIFSLGLHQDVFLATRLISAYSTCGVPSDSRIVFNSIHPKNIFLWNSFISGYSKNYMYEEAFHVFKQMCRVGESPDNYSFATVSKICGEIGDLVGGKVIHCKSIEMGFVSDTVVANSIMAMYCKCEDVDDIRKLFDEMPRRNTASWNVLISGYAILGNSVFDEDIWSLMRKMQMEGVRPDAFTLSNLLPLCSIGSGKLDYGRELHCFIVRNELGLVSDAHIGCCLIDMYCRSNNGFMGRRVFDQMNCRNVVSWTAMITGYVQNGDPEEALKLFREMQMKDRIEPNRISLLSAILACSSLSGLIEGKQIHGFSIRKELNYVVSISNALIDMYSKCGKLDSAKGVFEDDSFCKDVITWSSMISGYGLHGKGQEAIFLYDKMHQLGIKPDVITLVGVLSACSRSGLVSEGLNIYSSMVIHYGITPTMEVCACVVDLLGRSSQLDQALNFIKSMPMKPGPSVWGALVSACLTHGNLEMQDLAYKFLIQLEPENPSNYVSLSNTYASSRQWDVVATVRTRMKERGLKKLPGCSWISINSKTHSFFAAGKTHPCSDVIYETLDELILTIKEAAYVADFGVFDVDL